MGMTLDIKTREKQKKIRKFKESAWKCVYFLSAELFALYITYDEPWFTIPSFFGKDLEIKLGLILNIRLVDWLFSWWQIQIEGIVQYAGGFYTY